MPAYLSERGFEPYIYPTPRRLQDRIWEREQALLARWISKLPTPIGLFACDDDRGREVLEVCGLLGLHVPEDIAVIGGDNDEVFCELSDPPLSSIALNAETAGYRAAALLDAMMHGRVRKRQKIMVEALGVVTRRSTDIVAVEDEDISSALQFIRCEQGKGISVEDVVREVAVSRRNLEKRFAIRLAAAFWKRFSSCGSIERSDYWSKRPTPSRKSPIWPASARQAISSNSFSGASARRRGSIGWICRSSVGITLRVMNLKKRRK